MRIFTKTFGYLLIIFIGWGVGEYAMIPSFSFAGFNHIQPSLEFYDKALSITLFSFSLALMLALYHNFWLLVTMFILSCGFFGNMIDELTNRASVLGSVEMISLLFALGTTTYFIYQKKKRKTKWKITK